MADIIETASICTACAAITGAFVSGIAFITTQLFAPAIAAAAQHTAAVEVLAKVLV